MKPLKDEKIFTPGPVELPDRIREILGRQIIHHRTPEFREAFLETRELFKQLVDCREESFVFFASSGTGAMEAAILNFFEEGDKVLAIVGGKFGERWAELGRRWGLNVAEHHVEWGESVDPEDVRKYLRENPDTRGVLVQMSESSTGAYHDVKALAQITGEGDALLVVDAITALGVYNMKPHSWGLDVVVGGSQKAFMLPPGLSMLWFSEKARRRLTNRAYYFSVREELEKQMEGQTAWTPAINLILALRESLSMLLEEGIENVERRYRIMSEGVRRAAKALGMKPLPENPSIALSVLQPPAGVSAEELRRELLRMGVRTAGGQGRLRGRVIRISHMGMGYMDLLDPLCALELSLKKLSSFTELGSSIGRYLEVISGTV